LDVIAEETPEKTARLEVMTEAELPESYQNQKRWIGNFG